MKRKLLCLFDVDGTLTKPRQVISNDVRLFLQELQKKVSVGIVGGSDLGKISEQMGGNVVSAYDYVFAENGLVAYKNGDLIGKESILRHMGEEKLQMFINFCMLYMSGITLPAKRKSKSIKWIHGHYISVVMINAQWPDIKKENVSIQKVWIHRGNFIEFRSGLINVSPVGRGCSQEERDYFEKYDKEHKVREKFVQALENQFPDLGLVYSIGGQISFDCFPKGWDKTFCLSHLEKENFEAIHFFGDKTFEGGNDYEIYIDPRIDGHKVTSPDDTIKQATGLFFA